VTLEPVAFVFGATGFVGREVVRQLCVRGTRVIAHVRPDSKQLAAWAMRFANLGAELDTTPWQVNALGARLAAVRPSWVYILIGTTRAKARADGIDGDIYEQVDYGLTKIAIDATASAAIAPRIVYLSAIGADPAARGGYMRWRGKAEQVVKESGMPWVMARPSLIVGKRDEARAGERTAAAIGDGLLAVARVFGARTLRDRYRSTSADVLASALIRLAESPDAAGTIADGASLR
jgi:uncharacterized protein YbjT (DUF2867 family)